MRNRGERRTIDKVFTYLAGVAAVTLLVVGGLAWWAYSFTSSSVHDELASQQIYFPKLGSPELASSKIGPYLDRYAGKQLLTAPEAKAYADHFIAVHLSEIAGGKTYAQVSAESQADPSDAQLKAQAQTLFQGETLRGLLLGDAYAFGTVGHIAEIAAGACFVAGGLMIVGVGVGVWRVSRLT